MQQPAPWKAQVLGALCFSTADDPRSMAEMAVPCKRIGMRRLDVDESLCEVWRSSGPVTQGRHGAIDYRHDPDFLFGVMTLAETDFAAVADNTAMQQAAASAYSQVFDLIEKLDYPCLFRFWNYLPDINVHSNGLERYRQFNEGRQDAYAAHGHAVTGNVPAACALGAADGPLTIAFLAGRVASTHIENPRQISAYHYPPQYGPRSPVFSRATLLRLPQEEVLFVSGTASVVGHATLHADDVLAQTRETLNNVKAVLTEANRTARQPGFDLASLKYKVYVRRAADFAPIRVELARGIGTAPDAVYLQADICREDLLLEIEATGVLPLLNTCGQRN